MVRIILKLATILITVVISCTFKNESESRYDLGKTTIVFSTFGVNDSIVVQKLYFTKDSLLGCICLYRGNPQTAYDSVVFRYGEGEKMPYLIERYMKGILAEYSSFDYSSQKMVSRNRDNHKDSFVYVDDKLFSMISGSLDTVFFSHHNTFLESQYIGGKLYYPLKFQYLDDPYYILNTDKYEQQYFQITDTSNVVLTTGDSIVKKYVLNGTTYPIMSDLLPVGTNDNLDSVIYIYTKKGMLLSTEYFFDTLLCTGCNGILKFKVVNKYEKNKIIYKEVVFDSLTSDYFFKDYKIIYNYATPKQSNN